MIYIRLSIADPLCDLSGQTYQYAVVTNGALLKRLKGTGWESKTVAHQAAEKAMKIFDDYVNTCKKRVLRGFTTKDFKYKILYDSCCVLVTESELQQT